MTNPLDKIDSARTLLEGTDKFERPRIAYRLDCFVNATLKDMNTLDAMARNGDIGFALVRGVPYITLTEDATNEVIACCHALLNSHIGN